MCRNINTLHNFEPSATEEEIRASALQYVRKMSGMQKPSEGERGCLRARRRRDRPRDIQLLDDLVTSAPPRDREVEAAKSARRAEKRFGAAVSA